MGEILTGAAPLPHSRRVGRKPIEDKTVLKINFAQNDLRYIDAVAQHFGLSDRSAALRFAVRELARREKLKVESPPTEEG